MFANISINDSLISVKMLDYLALFSTKKVDVCDYGGSSLQHGGYKK